MAQSLILRRAPSNCASGNVDTETWRNPALDIIVRKIWKCAHFRGTLRRNLLLWQEQISKSADLNLQLHSFIAIAFLSFDLVASFRDDSHWEMFCIFTHTTESAVYPAWHRTNFCTLDEAAGWQESAAESEDDNTHCVSLSHQLAVLKKKKQRLPDIDKLAAHKTAHCSSLILRAQQQQAKWRNSGWCYWRLCKLSEALLV